MHVVSMFEITRFNSYETICLKLDAYTLTPATNLAVSYKSCIWDLKQLLFIFDMPG